MLAIGTVARVGGMGAMGVSLHGVKKWTRVGAPALRENGAPGRPKRCVLFRAIEPGARRPCVACQQSNTTHWIVSCRTLSGSGLLVNP